MLHSTNATAVALRLRLFPLNSVCSTTRNTFSVLLDASSHVRRRTAFLSAPWMTKPMWKHRAVQNGPAMYLHSSPPSADTMKAKKGSSFKSTQSSRTQSQQEEKNTEDSENLDTESEDFVEQELADHVWLKGEKEQIEQEMQHWVKKAVIGLQLCPFAKLNETRIKVSEVKSAGKIGLLLEQETQLLLADPKIASTLVVLPKVGAFRRFDSFNMFVNIVTQANEEDEVQIAQFHPGFMYADTHPAAAENYTSRSPYPTIHLLRTQSITIAREKYGEEYLLSVAEKNAQRLTALGVSKIVQLLSSEEKEGKK